jgi:hypothetical protein
MVESGGAPSQKAYKLEQNLPLKIESGSGLPHPRNSALLPEQYSTTGSMGGQECFALFWREGFTQGVNEYVGIEKDSITHSSGRACKAARIDVLETLY